MIVIQHHDAEVLYTPCEKWSPSSLPRRNCQIHFLFKNSIGALKGYIGPTTRVAHISQFRYHMPQSRLSRAPKLWGGGEYETGGIPSLTLTHTRALLPLNFGNLNWTEILTRTFLRCLPLSDNIYRGSARSTWNHLGNLFWSKDCAESSFTKTLSSS